MFQSKGDYDRGVNCFSPEGRLFQVEYAIEAIKLGSSALGIKVNEGVVLAVERRINSNLMEPSSVEKIFEVDSHIGSVAAGLIPDSRVLIDCARVESQNHRFMFNEPIRVKAVAQAVSDLALNFGEGDINTKKKPMVNSNLIKARPYGVALIIAGVDDSGPKLYYTDPSGTMTEFEAKGMGAADEGIQSLLEEHYKPVQSK